MRLRKADVGGEKLKGCPPTKWFSIGNMFADVARNTTNWYFVLAPLTLSYLGVALYLVRAVRPMSYLFPATTDPALAVLLDLCAAALPLIGVIIWYVRRLNARRQSARAAFVGDYEGQDLVQALHNPNLVYLVLRRDEAERIHKMQIIWNVDDRYADGAIYTDVVPRSVVPFEADRFLND